MDILMRLMSRIRVCFKLSTTPARSTLLLTYCECLCVTGAAGQLCMAAAVVSVYQQLSVYL